MNHPFSCVIFDLDGTLLETLQDLTDCTNWALARQGWPTHTVAQVRGFVGNGLYKLIERAVPAGTPPALVDQAFAQFKPYYVAHCMDASRPYDGIIAMLTQLHSRGIATALVTNKAQTATDLLYERFFKDVITVAVGQQPGLALKPARDEVDKALALLKADPENAIYVGDSEVDKQTADNAGLPCALCAWGFRGRPFIDELKPLAILDRPSDVMRLV